MAESRRQLGRARVRAPAARRSGSVSISTRRSGPMAPREERLGRRAERWARISSCARAPPQRPRVSRAPADDVRGRPGRAETAFRRARASPRSIASSIGSGCSAGGVQMSTKSIAMRRRQLVERRRTSSDCRTRDCAASARRSRRAIDDGHDPRVAACGIRRPVAVAGDLAEADDRPSQHERECAARRSRERAIDDRERADALRRRTESAADECGRAACTPSG